MVKKYILLLILFCAIAFNFQSLKGQENISMYNMRTLPQTSKLNPAFQTEYNGHVGGLIPMVTPVFGQAFPGVLDLDIHSSSFAYDDFIYPGTGQYSDSLVWAFNSDTDARKFVDKLDKVNHLNLEYNLNILNFGFRTDDIYWSFHALNKTTFDLAFPGGLVELMVKGNAADDISPNIDLSGLGVDFLNYMEYGVSASAEIIPNLKLGLRGKALAGIANLETVKSDLQLNSYGDSITLMSDMHFRASQPAFVLEDLYYDFEGDSLVSESHDQGMDTIINDLGYDFGNPGFAIDFGLEYQIMPELRAFASITDLGFIQWNTNVADVKGGGEFFFSGIDAVEYIDDNDETTEEPDIGDTFQDSIAQVFDIRKTDVSSYRTWLPTKIYVGAAYDVTDAIGFGALYKGVYYESKMKSAYSISANANLDNLSATITYTAMEDNYDNIGVGFAGCFGGIQVYVVSDHVLEEIFPQTARDVNIRMGVNWIFGWKQDEAALIE